MRIQPIHVGPDRGVVPEELEAGREHQDTPPLSAADAVSSGYGLRVQGELTSRGYFLHGHIFIWRPLLEILKTAYWELICLSVHFTIDM